MYTYQGKVYCGWGGNAKTDQNWVANQWNHAVITRGSGINTAYMNGVAGSGTSSTTPADLTYYDVGLGGSCHTQPVTVGHMYGGGICEVIIENVCWSAGDVAAYYNQYK